MAHYTSIDHSQQAEFPDTSVAIPHDLAELLYFRSYQSSWLVKVAYYFSCYVFLLYLIVGAIAGARAFFPNFFWGTIYAISTVLFTRISCEVVLAIMQIRDHTYVRAHDIVGQRSAAAPVATYETV